ncbi:energy-coupled thiamine transporter ThiT [Enterococcus ureilyticus]|uniref:Energy-coupled thiamine transporter ThiT n=1 Tax=Enterococcus ureilyticus TaxID=1131292 RepID=A0A1E5HD52_9ENTE|nr:energy-coupled thiamine transporter ThiT [Enterococcus ureilyticus]MBM7687709.1 thiamine transporter [Enterococcus ureilyticus]MBO0446906.1 energy-coupled thiamine transporter ThiT [Enterococcus ureilyticus]OEG22776.1 energy-coupled thiamine transporter ThiT [Enterococcus ureilyticus]
MQRKAALQIWIEGTIVAAIAMVLSFIPMNIGSSFSISLGMIPITLYALRRGAKAGFFSAFIWGLLHFPSAQVYYLTPLQVIIEYILAFGFAGFAGLYSGKLQQTIKAGDFRKSSRIILYATFLGTAMRYFWHFLAGVIFWGSFALWGMNPWLFSFIMNGLSGLATAIATSVVLLLVLKINPKLFVPTSMSRFEKS